jgi:hypothetical protein
MCCRNSPTFKFEREPRKLLGKLSHRGFTMSSPAYSRRRCPLDGSRNIFQAEHAITSGAYAG